VFRKFAPPGEEPEKLKVPTNRSGWTAQAEQYKLAEAMNRELREIRDGVPSGDFQQHNDHLRHAGTGVSVLELEHMRAVKTQLMQASRSEEAGDTTIRSEVIRNVEVLEKQIRQRHDVVYDMFRQAESAYGGGIDKSRYPKIESAYKEQDKQLKEIVELKAQLKRGTPMNRLTKHIDNAMTAQANAARKIDKGTHVQVQYGNNKLVETHPLSDPKLKISNPYSMGSYLMPALAISGVSMLGYGLGAALMFAFF
jgi:hypothetical protein